VNHTKSIFARHGIPEVVVSDNGPQYTSDLYAEFARNYQFQHLTSSPYHPSDLYAEFARNYQFQHLTSSPYHPQGNGEAEQAVGTVKNLLKKCDNPFLALMVYCSTPLAIGYSPAELMGRTLRSNIPTTRGQRVPKVPDPETVRANDRQLKARQKKDHDSHHGVRSLSPLAPGDSVWVRDRRAEATVDQEVSPRSYEVTTSDGSYRRNRRDLIRLPDSSDHCPDRDSVETYNHTTTSEPDTQESQSSPSVELRRSKRSSRPPERLDPSWA
jgi:hypothetical protein